MINRRVPKHYQSRSSMRREYFKLKEELEKTDAVRGRLLNRMRELNDQYFTRYRMNITH